MKAEAKKPICISFGNLTYKNAYPFIVSVFYILKNYSYNYIKANDNQGLWIRNPLFFVLLYFIGQSFNGVFYLISFFLIKSKPKRVKDIEEEKMLTTLHKFASVSEKSNNWKAYVFYYVTALLSAVLISIINIITSSYDTSRDLSYEMRLFNLFFIALLSYFILKYPIHRHHWFSFIFVAAGLIVCFCLRFIYKEASSYDLILIYLVTYFGFSVRDVIEKWVMETIQNTPLKLLFFQGIFGLLTLLVLMPLYSLAVSHTTPFYKLIKLMFRTTLMGLCFVGNMLCCTAYTFFSIYTKYHFSPTAMPIAYSFAMILWKLMYISSMVFAVEKAFIIIGYVLLLIGCLIYDEIIILYCSGLEANTKKEIIKRTVELPSDNSFASIINSENDFVYT